MKKFPVSVVLSSMLILLSSSLFAEEINLSAALGLKDVLNELTDLYKKKNTDVTFKRNYGASGAIARQIENGAPADIFMSANIRWMDYMKSKKLIDDKSMNIIAYNVLVFVGKPNLKISSLEDIVKLDKIAIGSPKIVPAGEYAMQSIKKAGLEGKIEKKLVLTKDVRECLMYAERGEVDGAFIFKTVFMQGEKRNSKILFTVPQKYYSRITFPMALTITGAKKNKSVSFFNFLKSDESKAVLKKYGFIVK